ncbi:MAG: hypothetical protein IMZ55_07405 [Acidobacteria bacterium]|nr:hypothetical protein [Acidobacteriota bacterium]
MHTFTDTAGREWRVQIDVTALKRVKGLVGVDLLEAASGDLIDKLAADPVLLCDCLFALVADQAKAASLSDEEFGRGLAGDAIDSATGAMLEELIDFFPARRRAVLRTAWNRRQDLEKIGLEATTAYLESPQRESQMRQRVAAVLDSMNSGTPSISSPVPSVQTPAP